MPGKFAITAETIFKHCGSDAGFSYQLIEAVAHIARAMPPSERRIRPVEPPLSVVVTIPLNENPKTKVMRERVPVHALRREQRHDQGQPAYDCAYSFSQIIRYSSANCEETAINPANIEDTNYFLLPLKDDACYASLMMYIKSKTAIFPYSVAK